MRRMTKTAEIPNEANLRSLPKLLGLPVCAVMMPDPRRTSMRKTKISDKASKTRETVKVWAEAYRNCRITFAASE
jgi:hypothetical protein